MPMATASGCVVVKSPARDASAKTRLSPGSDCIVGPRAIVTLGPSLSPFAAISAVGRAKIFKADIE
jgi:hypothetical protein